MMQGSRVTFCTHVRALHERCLLGSTQAPSAVAGYGAGFRKQTGNLFGSDSISLGRWRAFPPFSIMPVKLENWAIHLTFDTGFIVFVVFCECFGLMKKCCFSEWRSGDGSVESVGWLSPIPLQPKRQAVRAKKAERRPSNSHSD